MLLIQIPFHAEFHNLGHQREREWLVLRELHRTLGAFIRAQLLLEGGDSRRRRVKANVICKRCEVYEITVQVESRNPVADFFRGLGRNLVDRGAHLPEQSLIFIRVALKVFVNIFGHLSVHGRYPLPFFATHSIVNQRSPPARTWQTQEESTPSTARVSLVRRNSTSARVSPR